MGNPVMLRYKMINVSYTYKVYIVLYDDFYWNTHNFYVDFMQSNVDPMCGKL